MGREMSNVKSANNHFIEIEKFAELCFCALLSKPNRFFDQNKFFG